MKRSLSLASQSRATSSQPFLLMVVMLSILSALTAGCDRVSANTAASEKQTESVQKVSDKSAPKRVHDNSITVYTAGDIADCNKIAAAEKTAALVQSGLAADSKAVVLSLGDHTYPVGKFEEFIECYQPTWGQFKQRTLPAPGNHEYSTPNAMGYFQYFGALAGPARRGYYRSEVGAWQVYSLNSNISGEQMQAQLSWLKAELAANSGSCTLAFWHHPLFTSGGHIDNKVMLDAWRLLDAAKADIVLAGHDHDYERLAPVNANGVPDEANGIRSFVVGTGGAHLTPMAFPKAQTETRFNSGFGVLKLTLKDKSYDWEFLPVEDGTFADKGSGKCH